MVLMYSRTCNLDPSTPRICGLIGGYVGVIELANIKRADYLFEIAGYVAE